MQNVSKTPTESVTPSSHPQLAVDSQLVNPPAPTIGEVASPTPEAVPLPAPPVQTTEEQRPSVPATIKPDVPGSAEIQQAQVAAKVIDVDKALRKIERQVGLPDKDASLAQYAEGPHAGSRSAKSKQHQFLRTMEHDSSSDDDDGIGPERAAEIKRILAIMDKAIPQSSMVPFSSSPDFSSSDHPPLSSMPTPTPTPTPAPSPTVQKLNLSLQKVAKAKAAAELEQLPVRWECDILFDETLTQDPHDGHRLNRGQVDWDEITAPGIIDEGTYVVMLDHSLLCADITPKTYFNWVPVILRGFHEIVSCFERGIAMFINNVIF